MSRPKGSKNRPHVRIADDWQGDLKPMPKRVVARRKPIFKVGVDTVATGTFQRREIDWKKIAFWLIVGVIIGRFILR